MKVIHYKFNKYVFELGECIKKYFVENCKLVSQGEYKLLVNIEKTIIVREQNINKNVYKFLLIHNFKEQIIRSNDQSNLQMLTDRNYNQLDAFFKGLTGRNFANFHELCWLYPTAIERE